MVLSASRRCWRCKGSRRQCTGCDLYLYDCSRERDWSDSHIAGGQAGCRYTDCFGCILHKYRYDHTAGSSKTAAITFPEGTFRAPGIYRYVLTESANSNTDITDVDGNVRYLDVYVVNDNVNGGCKNRCFCIYRGSRVSDFFR